jgi:molybdenum cofactor cytidylyltransferase
MGRAKAFLPFRRSTFLREIADVLEVRCSPVLAVFGYDAPNLIALAAAAGVRGVENPAYQLGMLTSLQAGLNSLPETIDCALFTLVDHPAISSSTVDTLLRSNAPIAIPRLSGKRGHPVLIRRSIIDEFLAEPASSKVRDVIDRHAAEIEYLEVEDPGISDDIDDPALYEKLLAREAAMR